MGKAFFCDSCNDMKPGEPFKGIEIDYRQEKGKDSLYAKIVCRIQATRIGKKFSSEKKDVANDLCQDCGEILIVNGIMSSINKSRAERKEDRISYNFP